MAHAQIPVWESVFNFTLVNIPNKTINLSSKLDLMVKAIYLQENTLESFYVNVTNIRLLILMLLAGYFPLLSNDESNVGWKIFHLISCLHGFNSHINF